MQVKASLTTRCLADTFCIPPSYYFDLISYVGARKRRLEMFKEDASKRKVGERRHKERRRVHCPRYLR